MISQQIVETGQRHGVTVIGVAITYDYELRCRRCGATWRAFNVPHGELEDGDYNCRNGCNDQVEEDSPARTPEINFVIPNYLMKRLINTANTLGVPEQKVLCLAIDALTSSDGKDSVAAKLSVRSGKE